VSSFHVTNKHPPDTPLDICRISGGLKVSEERDEQIHCNNNL